MPKNSVAKPRVPLSATQGDGEASRCQLSIDPPMQEAKDENVPEAKNVANWQQQITRI